MNSVAPCVIPSSLWGGLMFKARQVCEAARTGAERLPRAYPCQLSARICRSKNVDFPCKINLVSPLGLEPRTT